VKNSRKGDKSFQALSLVEDAWVDPNDQHDPFGVVKSGSVIITGPLKKVPRLFNEEWKYAEASISEFERHLSKIVEKESLEGVEQVLFSARRPLRSTGVASRHTFARSA
jgi:hypothetical protein